MKNALVCLLGALMAGCFIWACSLSSQNAGLTNENATLQRKYKVLQTLYNQTREEADALRGEDGEKAWAEQTALLERTLQQLHSVQAHMTDASPEAADASQPEKEAMESPPVEMSESIFTVPAPEKAEEEDDTEKSASEDEASGSPAAEDAPEEWPAVISEPELSFPASE